MHPLVAAVSRRLDAGGPLSLLGLGDSLTFGWMVERGFFDRFCAGLRAARPGLALGVRNAGLPGDTAGRARLRLPGLLADEPQLVFVQFGLNDCVEGVPLEDFREDLRALCTRCLEAGSLPFLLTSTPARNPACRRRIDGYYGVIRNVGADAGLPVAVLDRHWRLARDAHLSGPPLLMADGLHPMDAGHRLLAEGLVEAFFSTFAPHR